MEIKMSDFLDKFDAYSFDLICLFFCLILVFFNEFDAGDLYN